MIENVIKKPAPKGLGWGTTNIPKEKWIDPNKKYKTRNGKRVENLHIVLYNSVGDEVTYPVKGTVVVRERPRKTEYCIWSLDGQKNICFQDQKGYDLVQI
jgi:hypothetical protein